MTVLLVDDDLIGLEILRHHFTRFGYRVVTATNGLAALKILESESIRLIISDWEMPEMDGPTLCKALRSNPATKGAYFILLTSRSSTAAQIDGIHAGADDYLVKPFQLPDLLASVRIAERILNPVKKQAARRAS